MTRNNQVMLELDFNLYFKEGTPEADAAYYLKHGPIEVRHGVRLAVAAVFSAVGAALQGKGRDQVMANASTGRETIHGYIQESIFRLQNGCSEMEAPLDKNVEEKSSELIDYKNDAF